MVEAEIQPMADAWQVGRPLKPEEEKILQSLGTGEQASMRLNALGNELNFYDGKVQRATAKDGAVVRMLLDCGASHTFVSLAVAKRIGGRWDKDKSLPVALPNGERLYTNGSMFVDLYVGKWSGAKKVWAIDIAGYDVILGDDFLREHSRYVSFPERKMWLADGRGGQIMVEGVNTRALKREQVGSLNLLSKKDCRRAMRSEQTEMLLFIVKANEPEPPPEDQRIQQLLNEYRDVFPDELPQELPPKRQFEHHIDTRGADPVNQPAYPLPADKLAELKRQVKDLLDRGLIETSSSPWGFPVIFVKKPEGEWRM